MSRRFAVIFGRKQSNAAVVERLESWRQGKDPAGIKIFESGTTPPFRFCSDEQVRYPPSFLADVPDTATKVARLKSDVLRDLDVFAKNPRRLLDLYFDFIAARLETESVALEKLLRSLGGLFKVEDWVYSALRPLPNAVVFDPDDPETPPVAEPQDMVFWTGQTVLAIRLRGSGTPSAREAEASERLQATGARVVTIAAAELAAGIEIFSDSRFPPEIRSFWQGTSYPCSPFRPEGLPRVLSR